MLLPKTTDTPGWPEFISVVEETVDANGEEERTEKDYVRLRDGSDVPGAVGNTCIYGLLAADGYIDRSRQWLPALSTTRLESLVGFMATTWDSNEVLVGAGQPPIVIPPEPIRVPAFNETWRRYVAVRNFADESE